MPRRSPFPFTALTIYLFLPYAITVAPGQGDFPRRRRDDNYDVEDYGEATTVFRGLEEISPRVIERERNENAEGNVDEDVRDGWLSLLKQINL